MFILLDIETEGLNQADDQILDIAVKVWHADKKEARPCKQWYITYEHYSLTRDGILAVPAMIETIIRSAKSTLTLKEVLLELKDFIGNQKTHLVGANVSSFDWPFLLEAYKQQRIEPPVVSHRFLDLGPCFWTPRNPKVPGLKECMKMVGMQREVPHTAMGDICIYEELLDWKADHEQD